MKRLILVSGAFFLTYILFMTAIVPSSASGKNAADAAFARTDTAAPQYVLKEENDRLVVYLGDAVYLRTDTVVSSLPKKDRGLLERGIAASSLTELKKLIEDYCS